MVVNEREYAIQRILALSDEQYELLIELMRQSEKEENAK